MSITSVAQPPAITIDGVSTGTNPTGSLSVVKSGSYYYRSYYLLTGNSTAVLSTDHGLRSSNFSYSYSPTDTALLTSLASASALTYYIQVREYANSTAYTDGTPYTSLNSAAATITISLRHTSANVAAYNANTGGNMSVSWTKPSTHAGWRGSVAFYYSIAVGEVYPSANPIVIQTGSGYAGTGGSTAATGTVTTTTASLNEIRNMTLALPGVYLYAIVTTGWQLTGSATYFGTGQIGARDVITAWTVPSIETGSTTNQRYNNMKYWNGSQWVSPLQVKVWDGAQWVDFGTDGSYDTKTIKGWNGSQWMTFTKQGSVSYTYDTAAQALAKNPSLIDDDYLAYTYSTTTVEVSRQVGATWGAYASHLMSSANNYGWAGTTVGNDGSTDIISVYWGAVGPRWINRLRFRGANTTYCAAAPRIIDVKFLRADGTWVLGDGTTTTDGTTWTTENTHYTKYSIATGSYTAALVWGSYFTINAQNPLGFIGIRMRVLNDTTYKEITQSTRAAGIDIDMGTITSTNSWT